MKLLLTSDWQTSMSNMDLCEIALKELLAIAVERKVDAIINLGDCKEQYSPVHIQIVKFWVRAVKRIRDAGFRFIILRGNHDRISQSIDAKDWLPILRAAGAETVSKPRIKQVDDAALALLPFTSDKKQEQEWADQLYRDSRAPMPLVLLFHTEVNGAYITDFIQSKGITPSELHADKYTACFGGHLHCHHKLLEHNIWFVGSPFCQDWGEANQAKGYVFAEVTGKKLTVEHIQTKIPGWFEKQYLEEHNIIPPKGAYIRSKLPVTSKKISSQLLEEEASIAQSYPGCKAYVIPKLIAPESTEVILTGNSTKELVEQYISSTHNEVATYPANRIVGYLTSKLGVIESRGETFALRVLSVDATNVLSFPKVHVKYTKQGLVLLRGENMDWPKRSNGCLAKGTFIDVPRDLRKYPKGIPIEDLVDSNNFMLYSQSGTETVLSRAAWAKRTGKAVPVIKVKFHRATGSQWPSKLPFVDHVVLTPDHLMMLRDGTWKKAGELLSGDRLMPMRRSFADGDYFAIHGAKVKHRFHPYEHLLILQTLYGTKGHSWHGHHIDESKWNNNPENLEWLSSYEHLSIHGFQRPPTYMEHPRGFLGHTHTIEEKEAISSSGKVAYANDPTRAVRHRDVMKRIASKKRIKYAKELGITKPGLKHKFELGWTELAIARWYGTTRWRIIGLLKEWGFWCINNHIVDSIEDAGISDVYDIHVPDTNCFFANGVCVHNSGKTNLLSLLPVAWFGQTLKGQKNDEWACEKNEDPAEIHFRLKDHRGRKIEIVRGRRKHKLQLFVDGEDVSTGLTGKGKNETQGEIEKLLGYDLRMLLNSVYIDQTIANGFVFGTQKDRMDLVSKLCDLERFDKALKAVVQDYGNSERSLADENSRTEHLEDECQRLEEELKELQSTVTKNWKKQYLKAKAALKTAMLRKSGLTSSSGMYEEYQRDLDEVVGEHGDLIAQLSSATANVKYAKKRIATAERLIQAGKCPVCRRPSTNLGHKHKEKAVSSLAEYEKTATIVSKSLNTLSLKQEKLYNEIERYHNALEDATRELQHAKSLKEQAEIYAAEESLRNKKSAKKRSSITSELNRKRRILEACHFRIKELEEELSMLEASKKAFHRSGMPLYLAASLCPLLNRSAEDYAEIFYNSRIQILFAVIDGEFQVDIVNTTGSHSSAGQSVGESAMAGVIAAFALREAAPKTNLLILDEPGHGLDSEGARQFAQGLLKLKGRYETIIVTTHSPIIESILSGESQWLVRKQNGLSSLVVKE